MRNEHTTAVPPAVGARVSSAESLEQFEHAGDLLGQRARARTEHQVGPRRHLVGGVDAREAGELPGPGPGVEALGVAPLALLERGVDEDLHVGQPGLLVQGSG